MELSGCVFAVCENDITSLNSLLKSLHKPTRLGVGACGEHLRVVKVDTGCCGYLVTTRTFICYMMRPVCEYATFDQHVVYIKTELPMHTHTLVLLHSGNTSHHAMKNVENVVRYCRPNVTPILKNTNVENPTSALNF